MELSLRELAWKVNPMVDAEAKREAAEDRSVSQKCHDDQTHLAATAEWLARAHDQGNDAGVSRGYSAARISQVGYEGWEPSYPETTGYIIPTALLLAERFGDPSWRDRALRMADWEIAIQMESGAVMGSVVTARPSPAVFNTGQVIFGWLAAHAASGDEKYLTAARRAGDYLISVQEADGSWRKGNSRFALCQATTYNARVAWALALLSKATGDDRYATAARRNVTHALSKQNSAGWFADNCLSEPERPLLHTIVYAIRGIMETGVTLGEGKYVDASAKALSALLRCQRPDGGIPGRLAADWSSDSRWDCVTGDAQAAGAWLRIHSLVGGKEYRDAARRAIEFVKRTQNLSHPNSGICGGVKGSFPFDGPYGRYEMLNWAAKFFMDALLMIEDEGLATKGTRG